MAIVLIIIGLLFAFVGFGGCILPVIPGPPISFVSLLILSFAKNWEPFSSTFLIIMAAFMILISILDYLIPVAGAKKYGASKLGVWGSVIGLVIGVFLFPPWGIFIGAFVGALAGELVVQREGKKALRVGWGVFVGNMVGIGLKMAYSGLILFFYIKEMF